MSATRLITVLNVKMNLFFKYNLRGPGPGGGGGGSSSRFPRNRLFSCF